MQDDEAGEERGVVRRRRGTVVMLACGAAAAALLAGWVERRPIATHFIDGKLADAGVPADYRITAIGPFTERLEAVRLGDPAAPDLVARMIELDIGYGLSGPHVRAVRVDGVRLRARISDGRLSMGSLDRLLPAPSGKAGPALPDMDLTLRDATLALETPAGVVGAAIEGEGHLSDGFHGRLTAAAPLLAFAGCAIRGLTADIRVSVRGRQPDLAGPLDLAALACPSSGVAIGKGRATLDARLTPSLDGGRGGLALAGFGGRVASGRFDQVSGLVTVSGDRRQMLGTTGLTVAGLAIPSARAAKTMIGGPFRIVPGARAISFAGDLAVRDAALAPERRRSFIDAVAGLAGTPIEPLAKRFAGAADRLLASADADARLSLMLGGSTGSSLDVQRLSLTGRSGGGFVRATPVGGFGWRSRDRHWRMDGRIASGGDLPAFDVRLTQPKPGVAVIGLASLAPYQAGGARLGMTPAHFRWASDGVRFATVMALDGPLPSGRVEGLTLPVAGRIDPRGGFSIGAGCVPLAFRALVAGGMRLDLGRLRLCGMNGALVERSAGGVLRAGAVIDGGRLTGHSGAVPLSVAAGHVELSSAGIATRALAVRLGEGDGLTRLNVDSLDGRFDGHMLSGPFVGASAQIGHVPLVMGDMAGDWRFAGGALTLDGGLTLTDAAPTARFMPLMAKDATLRFGEGHIDASATLREPKTQAAISGVVVHHDLAQGSGFATLDVPGIVFAPKHLQPEALTPLTLGVIANVAGTVAGEGRIDWNGKGVTSTGRFHTEGIDLAAAFGPVKTIAGTIEFSDLLGMVTPPRQQVTIAEVNPGVAVSDGVVHYQLLGEQRVKVEDARWPFAGGELILDPTLLSFEQAAQRHLTFRVKGLDAAAFVQQLAFPNISATGTFDGVLPMIFDQTGGRIEDGMLVARKGGGGLAYVGELSTAQIGTMGKLAFDALRKIRYQSLAIGLNGRLDGEIISSVKFDGLRQDTGDRTLASRMIRNLPFRFNIQIKAPFRGLMGSARAFADPSILLDQGAPVPIQPAESETVR